MINLHTLSWICATIAVAGCILSAFKLKICWILWIISAFGFIYINYSFGDYGQMSLYIAYLPLDSFGYYQWNKEG